MQSQAKMNEGLNGRRCYVQTLPFLELYLSESTSFQILFKALQRTTMDKIKALN